MSFAGQSLLWDSRLTCIIYVCFLLFIIKFHLIRKTIYNAKYPGSPYKSLSPSPPITHLGHLQKRSWGLPCQAQTNEEVSYFHEKTKRRTIILWFLHLTYGLTLPTLFTQLLQYVFLEKLCFHPLHSYSLIETFFFKFFYKAYWCPKSYMQTQLSLKAYCHTSPKPCLNAGKGVEFRKEGFHNNATRR